MKFAHIIQINFSSSVSANLTFREKFNHVCNDINSQSMRSNDAIYI